MSRLLYTVYEKIGMVPNAHQARILMSDKRYNLVAGGEQAGKSIVASEFWLKKYLGEDAIKLDDPERKEPLLYWLVGASYGETQREYGYIRDWAEQLGILKSATKRVDPGEIILKDGARIVTKSAMDARTLSKEAPDGIIGCEASQLDIATYERMRGRTAPAKGWMFLAGTFESSIGWYPSLFTAWQNGLDDRQSFSLPSWTNEALYPGGEYDPEILALKEDSTDDFFMERIAGKPVPPRGLVIREVNPDVHVQKVPYVKGVPVHLAVDPGYKYAHAVLAIQRINGQERIFDEIYERNLITEDMVEIAQGRNWWKDVVGGSIDRAGKQHQAMAAPVEIWRRKGGVTLRADRQQNINAGDERFRSFLKINPQTHEPRMLISPKCKGLMSELALAPNPFDGQSRPYKWNTDREGNNIGKVPKDENNHSVKAVVYYLVDEYGYAKDSKRRSFKVTRL
jgi:hypothetical protein